MDLAISKWVVETFGNSKLFALVSKFLTYIGETGAIVMLVVILLAFKKTRRLGIYMGCIVGFSYIVNAAIFKPLIARDRPFIEYENLGQMCKLADYPFPDGYSMASGHSTASMSIAMTVFLFNRNMVGLLLLIHLWLVSHALLFVFIILQMFLQDLHGVQLQQLVSTFFLNLLRKKYLKKGK